MTAQDSEVPMAWESVQRTFEGFPLYLRRPAGLDFDAVSANFPVHLTITHELSFRRFDGAPESKYNRGLEEFDLSVTRYFAQTGDGQVVLVETFGGKAPLLLLSFPVRKSRIGSEWATWKISGVQARGGSPKRSWLDFHKALHRGVPR